MRSRTVREGSVGLLILLGLGLFGGLILWLRGFSPGTRSFTAIVDFASVAGMQEGATVQYRGVNVGKIATINPGPNGVAVTIEITPADLLIPRDVVVETNESGLIGETYIDMIPVKLLPTNVAIAKPLDPQCEAQKLIICNDTRITGQVGITLEDLIRTTTEFTRVYSDPKFVNNLYALTQNAAVASAELAKLSREFSTLPGTLKQELQTLSATAATVANSANQTTAQASLAANQVARTANDFSNTANQITLTTRQLGNTASDITNEVRTTARRFGTTADTITNTARQFGATANEFGSISARISGTTDQYSRTATQFGELAVSINGLVGENRTALVSTLNNFSQASGQLRDTLAAFSPTINKINTTFSQINSEQLTRNLEAVTANAATTSANAAEISANLQNLTARLNEPTTLLLLQQTLDSARATFENTQKITSDLDDLTGDPAFRDNLRNLVNGLGKLVSSTEDLEQQIEVAKLLQPFSSIENTALLNSGGNSLTVTTNKSLSEALQSSQEPTLFKTP